MFSTRVGTLSDWSADCMLLLKVMRNHSNEYWYMGSICERLDTQKKRILALIDTGM